MARQPRLGWRACIPLSDSDNQARASLLRQKHLDRKSTRLNSSHLGISYAVFCLKKKKIRLSNDINPENGDQAGAHATAQVIQELTSTIRQDSRAKTSKSTRQRREGRQAADLTHA